MTKTLHSILLLVAIFLFNHASGQEARSLTYGTQEMNSFDVYDWEDYNRIRGLDHNITFSVLLNAGEYDLFNSTGLNYTGSYQFLGGHSAFVRANAHRLRGWDFEPRNKYWTGAEIGTELILNSKVNDGVGSVIIKETYRGRLVGRNVRNYTTSQFGVELSASADSTASSVTIGISNSIHTMYQVVEKNSSSHSTRLLSTKVGLQLSYTQFAYNTSLGFHFKVSQNLRPTSLVAQTVTNKRRFYENLSMTQKFSYYPNALRGGYLLGWTMTFSSINMGRLNYVPKKVL